MIARRIAASLATLAVVLLALGPTPVAAQADGTPRWAGPFTTGGYIVSSPAVAPDGTIYVGTQDKQLYAIQPNGTLKWQFATGDWIDAAPAIGPDGTVYVGSWDGKFYALTPAGTKKWEFAAGVGSYIYSSPAVGADGTIYFGSGDGNFYALRSDGTLKWTYPAGDWIDSSPAIGPGGLIYYGSWDGNVYALRDEGAIAVEAWRFTTNGPVLSSPAIGRDGTVFVGANDGRLYALEGTTGAKRWDYFMDGTIESSAAIGPDGTIYLGGSTGLLHAIAPDGTLKWKYATSDPILSSPAVRADGVIVFGSNDSTIYALHPSGTLQWKVAAADWVDSSPVIAPDGTIYIGAYDKKLYALHGSGSPASGFSDWPMFRRTAQRSARVTAHPAGGQLLNLSTRALAGPGLNLIPGFVVTGSAAKPFLVRAIGPTLAEYQIAGPLANPSLELHTTIEGRDTVLAQNDNWHTAANAPQVLAAAAKTGAFPLPSASLDAALVSSLVPRAYSAIVGSVTGVSGIALVEVYDTEPENGATRLVNLSTRGQVGVGDEILAAGLIIGGTGSVQVLIRAIGPTLSSFGVPNVLARPTLTLFAGSQAIASNTGWNSVNHPADLSGAAVATGAFALGSSSADSVLLVTLAPGLYTVHVAGTGNTTGEALIEVYVVP